MLAAILLVSAEAAAPTYSADSVVNTATGVAGSFTPNGLMTIYGSSLSYGTQAASGGTGTMPVSLAGVSVNVGGILANLFYVSPEQVNVLIPASLIPGSSTVRLVREGTAGPQFNITLTDTAPGLFPLADKTVIATHADGKLISADSPAVPEEVVVLYAAGLGRTTPAAETGRPASRAAPIVRQTEMAILLDGKIVDAARVLYAGITPGSPGLYQVNLRLPPVTQENPEVRVFIGPQASPSYLKLSLRIQ